MAANQIRKVMTGLTKVTEKIIRKITLDITANLVRTTPIDTGFARANWVPSIGTPSSALVSPGSGGSSAAIIGYTLPMGSVFISNNVPYITRLNDGSSKQEPAGFIQRAIQKAIMQDLGSIAT